MNGSDRTASENGARRRAVLQAAISVSGGLPARAADGAPIGMGASAEAIAECLQRQVDAQDMLGAVACVTDRDGARIVSTGQSGTGRPLDGDSVFEIGSVTKVFTAMLMAQMAGAGEIAVTDPVSRYLPPEARLREHGSKPISLLDLATHTSGLPRLPGNFRPRDPANPYADYTVAKAYEALSTMEPLEAPGSHYAYSNMGYALLGHALSLRAGRSYEELVRSRICLPLGLEDTRITLTPSMRDRQVVGHDAALNPVPDWDFGPFAATGALRSTANDMRRLLECCLGRVASPVQPWLATMLDVRRQADPPDEAAAAGWFVQTARSDEVVWKDGGTGGASTFVGYSTRTGIGSVVLSNVQAPVTVAVGRYLVNRRFPNPAPRPPFPVDAAKLQALAGQYEVAPGFVLTVRSLRGRLLVQATDQAEYPVFAESETVFRYRDVDARLRFELGPDGRAGALTLHQNGRDMRGDRRGP